MKKAASRTSTYYPGLGHFVQHIDECNNINSDVLREVEWYNMTLIAPDSKYLGYMNSVYSTLEGRAACRFFCSLSAPRECFSQRRKKQNLSGYLGCLCLAGVLRSHVSPRFCQIGIVLTLSCTLYPYTPNVDSVTFSCSEMVLIDLIMFFT